MKRIFVNGYRISFENFHSFIEWTIYNDIKIIDVKITEKGSVMVKYED